MILSTTALLLVLARFCSMCTLELRGEILQPGGQLETSCLVVHNVAFSNIFLALIKCLDKTQIQSRVPSGTVYHIVGKQSLQDPEQKKLHKIAQIVVLSQTRKSLSQKQH